MSESKHNHECNGNHDNFMSRIPPCLIESDLSLQQQVIVSDICASSSHLVVNDKTDRLPYIKLAVHISDTFRITVQPETLRKSIHYISDNEAIKSFWKELSTFSDILHNKSTPFLCPPITQCQEPSCQSKLCVADIRVHKCITSKNEPDTTVAEVSLRCRRKGCKRFENMLYYNFETFGKNKKPKYWAGNMAGPYRQKIPPKRVHTKQVPYLPMHIVSNVYI